MKARYAYAALTLLMLAACGVWFSRWKQDEPRRTATQALANFTAALQTGNTDTLLQAVVLPAAIQGRTAPEQAEFLTKALRDEISAEGLAVLQRDGVFGPLTNIFPAEAQTWASQAGVKPEDCVAFKLERNGLRAEVVLALDSALLRLDRGEGGRRPDEVSNPRSQPSTAFKLVRCNNVKQLAAETSSTTDSHR